MSNALSRWVGVLASAGPTTSSSAPASAPATAPASVPAAGEGGVSPMLMVVASVGICVLITYAIYRWARPDKLRLATAPGRPNNIHPLHVLALYAMFFVVPWGIMRALRGWMGGDSPELPILIWSLAQVLWLPAILLVARATFPMGLARGMGLSARHWFLDAMRAAVAYLAFFPVYLLLLWLASLVPGMPTHTLLKAVKIVGPGWKALAILSAVVLAPLVEEIFFRGLVQSMLRRYYRSPWAAVVIAAVFFAATHMSLHWMPALFALGMVLGYNYERTGRLAAPMLIHAAFNAVNLTSWLVYGY